MNNLSKVFVFKISATIIFWCIPLILFPSTVIEKAGLPAQPTYMFIRMLGWGYLSLCVGYYFGLKASLQGKRLMGPIWVGIISNGGAFFYLTYYGALGAWSEWGVLIQFIGWSSVFATAVITLGLIVFGVRGSESQIS